MFLWIERPEFRGRDTLLGDALLLGPADVETGDTLPVPDDLVTLFFETETYAFQIQTYGDKTWNGNQAVYPTWTAAANSALALARRWTLVDRIKVVAA